MQVIPSSTSSAQSRVLRPEGGSYVSCWSPPLSPGCADMNRWLRAPRHSQQSLRSQTDQPHIHPEKDLLTHTHICANKAGQICMHMYSHTHSGLHHPPLPFHSLWTHTSTSIHVDFTLCKAAKFKCISCILLTTSIHNSSYWSTLNYTSARKISFERLRQNCSLSSEKHIYAKQAICNNKANYMHMFYPSCCLH